jgi:hypothetical protein
MDESAVSIYMPEPKLQSRQWPIKTKVAGSRTKPMVLAFFDNKGKVYTNHMPGVPT